MFIAEFVKHNDCFPTSCNANALLTRTILAVACTVPDPLWFDVNCTKYDYMIDLVHIVQAGFVDNLLGLAFHKIFHNLGHPHPFYKVVCNRAAKINKDNTGQIVSCIMK